MFHERFAVVSRLGKHAASERFDSDQVEDAIAEFSLASLASSHAELIDRSNGTVITGNFRQSPDPDAIRQHLAV